MYAQTQLEISLSWIWRLMILYKKVSVKRANLLPSDTVQQPNSSGSHYLEFSANYFLVGINPRYRRTDFKGRQFIVNFLSIATDAQFELDIQTTEQLVFCNVKTYKRHFCQKAWKRNQTQRTS